MTHYLIKQINCIVSDAEIKELDWIYRNVEPCFIRVRGGWNNNLNLGYKKIEYSNNTLEGLKPFELVDDNVESLALKYISNSMNSKQLIPLTAMNVNTFIAGYKAKAGFTEEDLFNAIQYGIESSRESLSVQQRLDIFLQKQESRPIEVIQISDSVFKIKNHEIL